MSVHEEGLKKGMVVETLAELLRQHPHWTPADAQRALNRMTLGRVDTDEQIAAKVVQNQRDGQRFFGLRTARVDPNKFIPANSILLKQMEVQPAGTKFPRPREKK